MDFQTLSTPWTKIRSSNSTDTSITAKTPTVTEPTGTGVIELGSTIGSMTANGLVFIFYALGGASALTFLVRVTAWRVMKAITAGRRDIWLPYVLTGWTCQTSTTFVGISGQDIGTTEYLAVSMTMTTNYGTENVSVETVSTGNDVAHAVIDAKGAQKVEVQFSIAGGGTNPTSCNGLYGRV